jgi:hypothetical protein
LSSFAPLCGGGLLTVLNLGIAVMGWEVVDCNTASSVTAERARSKGFAGCSIALQKLRVRKSGELYISSRLQIGRVETQILQVCARLQSRRDGVAVQID